LLVQPLLQQKILRVRRRFLNHDLGRPLQLRWRVASRGLLLLARVLM
jgi:hypothetical protein